MIACSAMAKCPSWAAGLHFLCSRFTHSRPERVPCVEVEEVLSARDNPAGFDVERHASCEVETLAVALGAAVVHADGAPVVARENILKSDFEGAVGFVDVPKKLSHDTVAAPVITADVTPARRMPRDLFAEKADERPHICLVQG